MAYCVHCGVRLGEDLNVCPLCHTPVLDPAALPTATAPSFFATRPALVKPASKRELAVFITVMLASVAVCCGAVDLIIPTGARGWSFYVMGAVGLLWLWFVPPLFCRTIPVWARCLLDMGGVALYMALIACRLDGMAWFWQLVLPVLALAAVIEVVLCFALRGRSILSTVTILIGAVGLYLPGVELAGDLYIHGVWQPGWSIVVAAVCAGLIFPLLLVRRVPSLREEARRRFHL